MQDMKQLNEMGAITDSFMDDLLRESKLAESTNMQEEFLRQKSGYYTPKIRDTKPKLSTKAKKQKRKNKRAARRKARQVA